MTTTLSVFGGLFLLSHMYAVQALDPYTRYSQLNLPPGPFGPDSVALDRFNQGPYAGVSDGRILKYNGTDFQDFAYLSPNRTKQLCDGVTDINLGQICGRPLGFSFDPSTGNLYVVGAYGGLYRVGPQGGLATLLATSSADGVPFTFLTGADFDQSRNVLYFTDASLTFTFKDVLQGKPYPSASADSTGRLMEYNIANGEVRVLSQGLPGSTGPAVSADGAFVLFSGTFSQQVLKYWLIGPKAGKIELVRNLPGFSLKIKRAPTTLVPSFWVAVNVVVQQQPRILNPYAYKIDSNGQILLVKDLSGQYPNTVVNVAQEYASFLGSRLYIGSRVVPYVGIYKSGI